MLATVHLLQELRRDRHGFPGRTASRKLRYRHSLGSCCVQKGVIASNHDDVRIMDSDGSGEVDSVIPTKSTDLSQLARTTSEGVIDFDKVDLLEQGVELGNCIAQLPSREAAKSLRLGEGSAGLRID